MKKIFYLSLLLLSITSNTETNATSAKFRVVMNRVTMLLHGHALKKQLYRNFLLKQEKEAIGKLLKVNKLPEYSSVRFITVTDPEARRWPVSSTMTPEEKNIAITVGFFELPAIQKALKEILDNPVLQEQLNRMPDSMHSEINQIK